VDMHSVVGEDNST